MCKKENDIHDRNKLNNNDLLDETELNVYENDINEILGSDGYHSVPMEISINSVLKIKVVYESQRGVNKTVILQYRIIDIPGEMSLGIMREIVRDCIVDQLFSQIFSSATVFRYFTIIDDLNDRNYTGQIPLRGIYGKYESPGHFQPFVFKISRLNRINQQKLSVFNIPFAFNNWDSPKRSSALCREKLKLFSLAFTSEIEYQGVKMRCVGVHKNYKINPENRLKEMQHIVTNILPSGFDSNRYL